MSSGHPPTLDDVLASAARLQEVIPDAVLVGGTAAAYHAGHRISLDHDHVVADLDDRFETVLDHLEALDDWSTARVHPGKIILGSLGDIESGIRQLKRSRPLEIEVARVEDTLLVRVGAFKRHILLPRTVPVDSPVNARQKGPELEITFG